MVCYIFVFIHLNVFSNLPCDFFLTQWLCRHTLLNFCLLMNSHNSFLLLIYNFLARSEDIFCMISILLNLLSLVLWPSIWFILDCIPCAHSRTSALWVGLCGRRGSWPLGCCPQGFSLFNILWLGADGKGSPIFLAVST